MERCYDIDCASFNREEKDTACEVFTNINLCDESFPLEGLVSDLLYQVEAGKIQTGQNCTVDILKTWIK